MTHLSLNVAIGEGENVMMGATEANNKMQHLSNVQIKPADSRCTSRTCLLRDLGQLTATAGHPRLPLPRASFKPAQPRAPPPPAHRLALPLGYHAIPAKPQTAHYDPGTLSFGHQRCLFRPLPSCFRATDRH
jgi:hypothetical protein